MYTDSKTVINILIYYKEGGTLKVCVVYIVFLSEALIDLVVNVL